MKNEELYKKVLEYLEKAIPVAETELHYENPFQLLIAVILSAQCTDKRVNMVTPDLFAAYDTPEELAAAHPNEIFNYIKSVSFPNNKARYLVGMARQLVEKYGSEVPATLEELTTLPGVGRKTANLLLGDLYNVPGSVVCDTHCIRICERLGLTKGKEPEKVEQQLRKILPPEESSDFCHRIVLFGRDTCIARSPKCEGCPLRPWCKEFQA